MSAPPRQASVRYDVAIVGGGMVGAALACALGDSALKVAVIEPKPPAAPPRDDYDVRVSALTLASQAMLQALGAWSGIAERRLAPVRAMRVWHASGAGEIHFDAAEIGEPCLAYVVENHIVATALHERLQQYTNVHLLGASLVDLDAADPAQVTLSDGRHLNARLVVAADGADSAVRRRLHIPLRTLDMQQHAIVATVRTERAHADAARQKFLPTGPLAFLPLPEPRVCSIVWSLDGERADALRALSDTDFATELAACFGDRLGAIQAVGPRSAFPLALAHADRYIAERVALIGDAAHTVHPLAGQGVNLGFLDAAALAEVLLQATAERRDIGARHVLRRYERWRKGENLAMVAVTGGFKYLFGNEHRLLTGLRDVGLSLTNRVAPLKNLIMRRASGLDGDLPRLARRLPASAASARVR